MIRRDVDATVRPPSGLREVEIGIDLAGLRRPSTRTDSGGPLDRVFPDDHPRLDRAEIRLATLSEALKEGARGAVRGERARLSTEARELGGGGLIVASPPWIPASSGSSDRPYQIEPKGLPTDFLMKFCRLSDASPQAVELFAQRHGFLRDFSREVRWNICIEPIALWARWAAVLRGILAISTVLHEARLDRRGSRGNASSGDWLSVFRGLSPHMDREEMGPAAKAFAKAPTSRQEREVGGCVYQCLRAGGVGLAYGWEPNDTGPKFNVTAPGVLGLAARELAFTVARTTGLTTCAACGEPFQPGRKPHRGQPAYCKRAECQRAGAALRKRRERGGAGG